MGNVYEGGRRGLNIFLASSPRDRNGVGRNGVWFHMVWSEEFGKAAIQVKYSVAWSCYRRQSILELTCVCSLACWKKLFSYLQGLLFRTCMRNTLVSSLSVIDIIVYKLRKMVQNKIQPSLALWRFHKCIFSVEKYYHNQCKILFSIPNKT